MGAIATYIKNLAYISYVAILLLHMLGFIIPQLYMIGKDFDKI